MLVIWQGLRFIQFSVTKSWHLKSNWQTKEKVLFKLSISKKHENSAVVLKIAAPYLKILYQITQNAQQYYMIQRTRTSIRT